MLKLRKLCWALSRRLIVVSVKLFPFPQKHFRFFFKLSCFSNHRFINSIEFHPSLAEPLVHFHSMAKLMGIHHGKLTKHHYLFFTRCENSAWDWNKNVLIKMLVNFWNLVLFFHLDVWSFSKESGSWKRERITIASLLCYSVNKYWFFSKFFPDVFSQVELISSWFFLFYSMVWTKTCITLWFLQQRNAKRKQLTASWVRESERRMPSDSH